MTPGYSPCLSQQPRAKTFSRPLDRLGQAGSVTGALGRNQIRSPPSSLAPPDGPHKKQNVIDSQGGVMGPCLHFTGSL